MGNHDPYSDSSGVRASLAPKATFTTASQEAEANSCHEEAKNRVGSDFVR